jgi:adenylate cyclase
MPETWVCSACGGENPEGMRFCGHCGAPVAAAEQADQPELADALRSFVAGPVADRLIEAGGHLPEERRLITALFADVSGFTSLAERLDPEQLLEVIDPVISALSSIVGRYEGYVEKFAGDALLALFGAPVSHENDAARALLVALEMHSELGRICSELPYNPELSVHIGVNSGHGIARILGSEARMDYAVLGDSVILAQRLESAAPSGETYVSETTVRLTEDDFEFEPVGQLTLKGRAEPVPAWRLVGRRRVRRRRGEALIGRERELDAVGTVLDGVLEGRGAVVAVTGEPGVGKSRLTAAVAERAEEARIRWLHGRCLSYGAGIAYWPYADLLRRWAGIHADTGPADAAASLAGAFDRAGVSDALPLFARLLGVSPPGAATALDLEPEAFRRALHAAFADWLRALTAERPLVVALEDLHWADSSSLELTRELAVACAHAPILLYLIGRPEVAPSLAELAREGLDLRLGPLDDEGIRLLMKAVLGSPPPATLAPYVSRRTAGNPLFVQEILRSLLDGEVLVHDDGAWRMRPGWDARTLPTTIEEVLSSRIDLLPRAAATTLQTAAVIGRRTRLSLLRAVATDVPEIERQVDLLTERGFLEQAAQDGEPVVAFHHALIQDAAYDRLLRRKRTELHRRVAEAAEALYGAGDDAIDLLARHLYLGGGGPKAVEYLARAGERAKALFANEEAILHLSRASELAPENVELRLAVAELHELVGHYDDALSLYAYVRDTTSDVRAWRGLSAIYRKRGEYEQSLSTVSDALGAEAAQDGDALLLWLERGWTLLAAGRYADAIAVHEAALETAGDRQDRVVAQLLMGLVHAETVEGAFDAALEHALEAKRIFDDENDLRGLTTALRVLGRVQTTLGRLDDAAATLQEGVDLAERIGSVEELGGCLINLGLTELQRGRLAEAVACDRRAIEVFESVGHDTGRAIAYANLAEKLLAAGDADEALEYAGRGLELAREIGNAFTVADATQTLASIYLRQDRLSEAAATAEEAARLFVEMGATPSAAQALDVAAEAWERAGDEERAHGLSVRARSLA